MLTITQALVATAALAFQPQPSPPNAAKDTAPAAAPHTVNIRVLDQDGKPAKNVLVGCSAMTTDQSGSVQTVLAFWGQNNSDAAESDELGLITTTENSIFYGDEDKESKPIIAWTKDHALLGMAELPRPIPSEPLEVRLAPACRVEITTTSKGLEALGQKLTWSNVYVSWKKMRPMSSDSRKGEQLFFLPPGDYKLNAYGADADSIYPDLTIAPGEKTKTITLDLPASRIAQLTGKPAPELTNIKGWVNGGPVKLADLKGKVVLLDFWGYWCGPCVHSMPALAAMHEQYKDKGLVIIAVHDASATDLEDMKAKLEKPKKEVWGGKDLPFLVALDGPGKPVAPEGKPYGSGATTAAYGITGFPTQVLIDKDGNVVGRVGKGQIEKLLSELNSK